MLLVKLDSDHSGYDEKELFGYYRQLLDRLQAIPGVSSAAVSAVTPLSGAGAARFVEAEGHSDIAGARRYVSVNWVTPKYFETYRTPFSRWSGFHI